MSTRDHTSTGDPLPPYHPVRNERATEDVVTDQPERPDPKRDDKAAEHLRKARKLVDEAIAERKTTEKYLEKALGRPSRGSKLG